MPRVSRHLRLLATNRGENCGPSHRGLGALLLVALALGCRGVPAPGPPGRISDRPIESGLASWYGPGFDHRRTASGERFNGHELTAAHRKLPFGTVVDVVNLDNGRSVRVRINDRGPFVRRRIIDLSRAAAEALEILGPGTARVELYLVAQAPALPPFTVQVGAFLDPDRARLLQAELALHYPSVAIYSDGTWHRVQVARFGERAEAETLRRELARLGYPAVVVRADPLAIPVDRELPSTL
jgi:rare lipoprotein A